MLGSGAFEYLRCSRSVLSPQELPFSLINWLCFYHGPVLSLGHKKSQWLPAGATPRTVSTACQPAANVCTLSSSRPSPPPFAFPGALGEGWEGKLPLEV